MHLFENSSWIVFDFCVSTFSYQLLRLYFLLHFHFHLHFHNNYPFNLDFILRDGHVHLICLSLLCIFCLRILKVLVHIIYSHIWDLSVYSLAQIYPWSCFLPSFSPLHHQSNLWFPVPIECFTDHLFWMPYQPWSQTLGF